jgi:hypothetical protein
LTKPEVLLSGDEGGTAVRLEWSGKSLSGASDERESSLLGVVANYVLDSVPHDLFRVSSGSCNAEIQLSIGRVSTRVRRDGRQRDIGDMEISFVPEVVDAQGSCGPCLRVPTVGPPRKNDDLNAHSERNKGSVPSERNKGSVPYLDVARVVANELVSLHRRRSSASEQEQPNNARPAHDNIIDIPFLLAGDAVTCISRLHNLLSSS